MAKNQSDQQAIKKKNTDTAHIIASISPYSERFIRMVMNGERENDKVLTASIFYEQEKSKLIQKVKELVPFDKNPQL